MYIFNNKPLYKQTKHAYNYIIIITQVFVCRMGCHIENSSFLDQNFLYQSLKHIIKYQE